jgi:hypothetical protein
MQMFFLDYLLLNYMLLDLFYSKKGRNGWLVVLHMGKINCHTVCIVGVILGDGGAFILGVSDAVVKEQIITFA